MTTIGVPPETNCQSSLANTAGSTVPWSVTHWMSSCVIGCCWLMTTGAVVTPGNPPPPDWNGAFALLTK